jgi:hypothetical protein
MRLNHETSRTHPYAHDRRPDHAPRRLRVALGAVTKALLAALVGLALLATPAAAAAGPHYDVPAGYTRCPHATAWHGFFKWASADHASCTQVARVMRAYAAKIKRRMPHAVDGYRCRIFYWRNEDGDVYASRHVPARRQGRPLLRRGLTSEPHTAERWVRSVLLGSGMSLTRGR